MTREQESTSLDTRHVEIYQHFRQCRYCQANSVYVNGPINRKSQGNVEQRCRRYRSIHLKSSKPVGRSPHFAKIPLECTQVQWLRMPVAIVPPNDVQTASG